MSNAGVTRPAIRVATTIGVFKWIMVVVTLLAGVITATAAFSDGGGDAFLVGLGVAVGAILSALLVWVMFGWFEHTLRALAEIAANTGAAAPGYQQPPQSQPQPPSGY